MAHRDFSRGEFLARTARLWRHRNLFQMWPYVASAAMVGEGLASLEDAEAARAFSRLLEPA
ncbi:MAG TPA: hypothetical protein VE057_25100 [Archangium sp.]|nr:hypothetical protein [Archangium sp.]